MKIFKFLAVALVAMLGFTACDKDCDHDFIEHDFTQDIVGTWTTLNGELAEAMVIKADGSFTTTGIMKGGSMYEEKGTIKVVNNKVTLAFDGDKDTFEGRLELVAGKSLSIVLFDDNDVRLTYDYCENDLSDEIVGMWVCTQKVFGNEEESTTIVTYKENGKSYFTGFFPEINSYVNQIESDYKVVGNLLFSSVENGTRYLVKKFGIIPNGTELGDIMTTYDFDTETNPSFFRVKQNLDLTGTYDYSSAYVSNAKGKDEDFTMLGHTFNMANINAGNFDMMFRSELFCVDLNTNTITQHFLPANGQDVAIEIPITVEGNKVTLDLSAENPAYRKVDMYMFQDADNSQLHMYMHTNDFINYFANMELYNLLADGEITADNTTAIEKVYTDMEARIESINVSLILKARK